MDFENKEIDVKDLPQFSRIKFYSLQKRFPLIRLCVLLVVYLVLVIVVVFSLTFSEIFRVSAFTIEGLLLTFFILLLLSVFAPFLYLSTKAMGYAVREHDIVLKSGLFWKKKSIQPLARIQHVEITCGPIDKHFGLANLRLFSAGTNKSSFRIPGIEYRYATQIKQFISDYQKSLAKGRNIESSF